MTSVIAMPLAATYSLVSIVSVYWTRPAAANCDVDAVLRIRTSSMLTVCCVSATAALDPPGASGPV
jgi:hypothetical protein